MGKPPKAPKPPKGKSAVKQAVEPETEPAPDDNTEQADTPTDAASQEAVATNETTQETIMNEATLDQTADQSSDAAVVADATITKAKAKRGEITYNTVTMDDERVVDFAGKRKMLKTSIFNADGTIAVRLDFVNGESRTFTLPEALLAKFAAHGAEQKLGDEIAGLDDVEDCILAIDQLTDRLNLGEWGIKREAGGLAGTSVLARALVEHSKKTPEEIKNFLANKTHAQKVALRSNAALAPIIARLEAAKNKKKSTVDTEALLDELDM